MLSRPESRPARSGEFFAPLPLAALVLLVINDLYLKAACHNFITGKLSDLAVCFLMPLFLSELLGLTLGLAPGLRLKIGTATTAVLFSVLEVVPSAAAVTVSILRTMGPYLGLGRGYAMTSDVTDLACVPVVLLAYFYGFARVGLGRPESL